MLNDSDRSSSPLLSNKFVRFLLVGGFAAIVNFGSRFVYSLIVDFSAAVVLAVLSGMVTAFLLNKRFVFTASKNSTVKEVSWFVVINLLALLQTWGLSVYLVQWLPQHFPLEGGSGMQITEAVAHAAGILLPVFTSYIGHKYLTFRE